jgi:hypothetical protein
MSTAQDEDKDERPDLHQLSPQGRRRLDNPEDFVRVEIGTALKRGIRVIPVLVEGASIPQSGELPDDLKPLTRLQALNVSHDRFRGDSERLIGAVERALEAVRTEEQRKREEQERVDAERRQREEEERLRAQERAQAERLELERRQQEEETRSRSERQLKAEQERVEADQRLRVEQAVNGKDAGPGAPPRTREDSKEDHGTGASSTIQHQAAAASLADPAQSPVGQVKAEQQPPGPHNVRRPLFRWVMILIGSVAALLLIFIFGLSKLIGYLSTTLPPILEKLTDVEEALRNSPVYPAYKLAISRAQSNKEVIETLG